MNFRFIILKCTVTILKVPNEKLDTLSMPRIPYYANIQFVIMQKGNDCIVTEKFNPIMVDHGNGTDFRVL